MDARPREGTLMISQGMKSTWREKEKERVLQSAGKFALKVKRKDWFLFFLEIRFPKIVQTREIHAKRIIIGTLLR